MTNKTHINTTTKTYQPLSSAQRDRRVRRNNLNFLINERTSKHINTTNGGILMQNHHPETNVIYVNHIPLNKKQSPSKFRKRLNKNFLSDSALILLMRQGHIPVSYSRTIARYEILRNRNLADGPNRPRCLLMGKPKLKGKYAHTYVRPIDVEQAEKVTKLWRDSVYILQQNQCRELLDTLLQMETAANDNTLFQEDRLQNLRSGLRDLTRYYGRQQMAA
jgi:hypothetical protein